MDTTSPGGKPRLGDKCFWQRLGVMPNARRRDSKGRAGDHAQDKDCRDSSRSRCQTARQHTWSLLQQPGAVPDGDTGGRPPLATTEGRADAWRETTPRTRTAPTKAGHDARQQDSMDTVATAVKDESRAQCQTARLKGATTAGRNARRQDRKEANPADTTGQGGRPRPAWKCQTHPANQGINLREGWGGTRIVSRPALSPNGNRNVIFVIMYGSNIKTYPVDTIS